MTELRNQMIRAMELQNLSQNSQKPYLNAVSGLAKHYMQAPDQLTKEMIEDYLLDLKKQKQSALTTVGSVITGLRFFYNHVIGDQQFAPSRKFAKTPRKLPTVLGSRCCSSPDDKRTLSVISKKRR
jgi:site-specific recombinase XerD